MILRCPLAFSAADRFPLILIIHNNITTARPVLNVYLCSSHVKCLTRPCFIIIIIQAIIKFYFRFSKRLRVPQKSFEVTGCYLNLYNFIILYNSIVYTNVLYRINNVNPSDDVIMLFKNYFIDLFPYQYIYLQNYFASLSYLSQLIFTNGDNLSFCVDSFNR